MKIKDDRGYLIVAQNNLNTDYVLCARMLAKSIKQVESDAKICLLTDVMPVDSIDFDYVRLFPFGDTAVDSDWKLKNDWQCFYASPFRETIKLEADMIIPCSIKHWFDICSNREVVVTIGARDYQNQLAKSRFYRKIFDLNNLPDTYNAITYWRLGKVAQEFFDTVRYIFDNWDLVMSTLKYGNDQTLNTDLAYAIAIDILGKDQYTLPGSVPGIIHMKSQINNIESDNWMHELVWELYPGSLRINTVQQMWPFHYHVKDFAHTLQEYYGRIS
jgi:hypothetical protein